MLMYQPMKKHLTAKVSVMSTDFHSSLINCWQSRSRSYFVVEWTVLHLQRTCGFMTQFPWGWTRLTIVSWEVLPSVGFMVKLMILILELWREKIPK
jgi:hypothetical protein